MNANELLLECRGIDKNYNGPQVLSAVDFLSLKKTMSAGSGVYVPPQAAEGWKTPCALKKAMPVLHPQ